MTKSELNQIKAQQLMLLGAMTKMPEAERLQLEKARIELNQVVEQYGELGHIALAMTTIDWSIKEGADE